MVKRIAGQESGYVALLAVLVVGAVSTAIALVLLTTGADSQRSALVGQQSKQARSLAVACAEEALQQIHDNIAFGKTNTLPLGQGSCTYVVTVTAPTTRSIAVSATVGNVVKKIQIYATIGASSISITSWQEVG
jgi:hypothetical protein